jgi:hypothetical protein
MNKSFEEKQVSLKTGLKRVDAGVSTAAMFKLNGSLRSGMKIE